MVFSKPQISCVSATVLTQAFTWKSYQGVFLYTKLLSSGFECFPTKLAGPSWDQIWLSPGLASHPQHSICDLKSWCRCWSRDACPSSPCLLGAVAGQLALPLGIIKLPVTRFCLPLFFSPFFLLFLK